MIHLHTLGDTLITVGEKEIRPSSPMIFAALLYLGVERGRRVPRAAIQEMFFPDVDERSGSHSVRQLLYKLRQLGANLSATNTTVAINDASLVDDMAQVEIASLESLRAGFLPAYQPALSDRFDEWFAATRDHCTALIIRALAARMSRSFAAGDESVALGFAEALLLHDPLNEEGTLVRAKVLAASGQKQRAIALLAEYSAEVAAELRLPAESLRKRIQVDSVAPPLLGRDAEYQQLLAQQHHASTGKTTFSLIWGEAGIGKTRLAQELAGRAGLDGARVIWAYCQQHSLSRPFGALIDIIPSLMRCRGALGVAPESMEWLRRLEVWVQDGGATRSVEQTAEAHRQIVAAVLDLLNCVSTETLLLLIVEDAQWIDEPSRDFLLNKLDQESRIHLLITSRDRRLASLPTTFRGRLWLNKLTPLTSSASESLLKASWPYFDPALLSDCTALAGGNPLFLRSIAQHVAASGDLPAAKARIPDLMLQRLHVLDPTALLLARVTAILGSLGSVARIAACSALDDSRVLLGLQELADHGLVVSQSDAIVPAHQILSDTIIANTPQPLLRALYQRAAIQLETEGRRSHEAALLWSCAEFWLRGGNQDRAVGALRQCAGFAIELGLPAYALPALERAQEVCHVDQVTSLLEETIRIADLAAEDEVVLRNLAKYRAGTRGAETGSLHPSELAEIRALRRLGKDIWKHRDRLLRYAQSPAVSMRDRRRAARTFLIAAEESFAISDVVAAAPSLEELWIDDGTSDALALRMLFHLIAGDMSLLAEIAKELLHRIDDVPMLERPLTMNAIARCLFAAGETDLSADVTHREIAVAKEHGRLSDLALSYSRLADTHLTTGDSLAARPWIAAAETIIGNNPYATAYHLTNCIAMGIADANFSAARAAIDRLGAQEEAKKPHAVRSILGYEMVLQNASGELAALDLDVDHLLAIDDAGGHQSEHLFFAVGLFCVLLSVGRERLATNRFVDYVRRRRRERFPIWPAVSLFQLRPHQLQLMQSAVQDEGSTMAASRKNHSSQLA